jgi:hypothetical protein
MAKKLLTVIFGLKRCVLTGLLLFFFVFSGTFFLRNTLAKIAVDAVVFRVQAGLENANISLREVGYASVNVQYCPLLQIKDAKVKLSALFPEITRRNVMAYAKADGVDIHWSLKNPQNIFLEIHSIDGNFEEGNLPENIPFYGLKEALLRYELKTSDLLHPRRMSERLKQAVNDLYCKNYTKEDFRFKGDLSLRFDDTPFCVGFYTASVQGGGTVFRLDEADLRLIARNSVENECSDEEIDLMVKNPLKTPYIIYASLKTRKMVKEALRKDPSVPYDAYRHVLWSYHLTRKLGPVFAKKVTDARESRSDNSEAEHLMDYQNNKIGVKYALSNIPEAEILLLVRSDPEVVLAPQE